MTIKHMRKTVSAENENVVTNINDSNSGILSIIQRNLYQDTESETKEIDLSKHRLNLIEKSVNAFKNMVSIDQSFYTAERIAENSSGVFLVPTEQAGEGIYEEFYWGEISDSENYKPTDYVEDGKHYNFISLQSMSINLQPIKDELNNKVDKISGKSLSKNDFTDSYKGMLDGLSSTYATKSEMNNKVDTVSGKGLSTNDFNNTYKSLLDNIDFESLTITYDDNGTDVTETITFLIVDNNS